MQSGISASEELQSAFRSLLSSSTDRGLLVSISSSPERLIPAGIVKSTTSDFKADLDNLTPHIKDNVAAYIILREELGASGKCVAITYVPQTAPVRSKMLFASTRLTLTRELGTEHFTTTIFATSPNDLAPAGWTAHQVHTSLSAPLTSEEAALASLKEAEASESTGTSARRGGHVSKNITLPIAPDAADALKKFVGGQLALVQLGIDLASETLVLAGTEAVGLSPSGLASVISAREPRYSFFNVEGGVLFVYTCPTASSIKQRMLYAASRASTVESLAPEHGIVVNGKLEATDPEDVTEETVRAEMAPRKRVESEPVASKAGFARPKRPGRKGQAGGTGE